MGKRMLMVSGCLLFTATALAQGTSNVSAVGAWKLNLEKSTRPTKPKSQIVKITEDSPTVLKYIVTGVDATGKPIHETYAGAPDGQPHPFVGSATVTAAAYTRTGNTVHATFTLKNGGTTTQDITIADDGSTITIQVTSGDKSWTDVYDRVRAGQKKTAAKKAAQSGQ